jgi:uncharacterized protein YndB with AHSA1/START domain
MTTNRETRLVRDIAAPPQVVYRLLLDPAAIAHWRVPDGMRCQVHEFEAREGGRFRVSLTYTDPDAGVGKSAEHTDTYHGRFIRLQPDAEVTEGMEFETAEPSMQGWMTATYRLQATPSGTRLEAVHRDLPPGVSLADNEQGWSMALDKLARAGG